MQVSRDQNRLRHGARVVRTSCWLGATVAVLCVTAAVASATPQREVVILKDGTTATQVAQDATKNGITPDQTYSTAVSGYSGTLSDAAQKRVASDPNVLVAEPDVTFTSTSTHFRPIRITGGSGRWGHGRRNPGCGQANGPGNLGDGTSPDTVDQYPPVTTYQQFIPTELARIGLACSPTASVSGGGGNVDANVAVLDTGIQTDNPDLRVAGGVNCSDEAGASYADDYGHGTEVAGVLGAIDNSFGIVGAAPGADLYSVKVLDGTNNGDLSNIVCGVDWVAAHHNLIQVANMSLEGPGTDDHACGLRNHDALHYAICRAVAKGVTFVAGAGNDASNAKTEVPAAYDEVITVAGWSDTDGASGGKGAQCDGNDDDVFAQFSNYGPDIDLMGVATCITTLYNDGTMIYDDGTSFAAPEVSGAAADLLSRRPYLSPLGVKTYVELTADYGLGHGSHGEGLLDLAHI